MHMRHFYGSLAAMVLAIFANAVAAENPKEEKSHTGVVVSVAEGQLVMSSDGKEHTHKVNSNVRVTINGKTAKLEALVKGDKVLVTMTAKGEVDAISATHVETDPK